MPFTVLLINFENKVVLFKVEQTPTTCYINYLIGFLFVDSHDLNGALLNNFLEGFNHDIRTMNFDTDSELRNILFLCYFFTFSHHIFLECRIQNIQTI